jgi:DNA-binding GntR family transcriptional regulator
MPDVGRRREQLRHDVVSAIRDLILTRRVRAGDLLRLAPIAKEMDISITPVREALLMLTQDGWVSQEPNRGFRVLPNGRSDVEDIYVMWGAAEGELAGRAARNANAEDIDALRGLDARLRSAAETAADAGAVDRLLQARIHAIADAPKLQWFAESAKRLVPFGLWSSLDQVPGWYECNKIAHGPIIECIAAGDAGGAGAAVREHFRVTCAILLSWLDSITFWDATDAPVTRRHREAVTSRGATN